MTSSRLVTISTLVISVLVIAGCATIFKGSTQDVSFNSNPAKGNVSVKTLSGVEVMNGVTPVTLKLTKKNQYIVTVELAGYKPATIQLSQSLEGWFWGNLLCGGVIGMLIDWQTGAMWDLEPGQVSINLVTASLDGTDTRVYAVFMRLDDQGNLRSMSVPMIRNHVASTR